MDGWRADDSTSEKWGGVRGLGVGGFWWKMGGGQMGGRGSEFWREVYLRMDRLQHFVFECVSVWLIFWPTGICWSWYPRGRSLWSWSRFIGVRWSWFVSGRYLWCRSPTGAERFGLDCNGQRQANQKDSWCLHYEVTVTSRRHVSWNSLSVFLVASHTPVVRLKPGVEVVKWYRLRWGVINYMVRILHISWFNILPSACLVANFSLVRHPALGIQPRFYPTW